VFSIKPQVFYYSSGVAKSIEFAKNTEHISLSSRKISSIEFIHFANFPFLKSINLSSNQIEYLSFHGIESCNRLESLSLSFNRINDVNLESLIKCNNLELLDFTQNKLTTIDFSVIAEHPNLKIINLIQNLLTIIDFEPLASMPNLTSIKLYNNQLESIDLEPLSECENLMHLDIGNNPLRSIDLTPLRKVRSLRTISCPSTKIIDVDLTPLSNLDSLEKINFSFNNIRMIDLSPLANCRLLKEIRLDGNQIQELDISPLFHCLDLQRIIIDKDLSLWVPRQYESIKSPPKWVKSLNQSVKIIDTASSDLEFKKQTRTRKEKFFFIEPKEFKGFMYDLVREINDAFNAECYVCTAFLSRKLLESLVISILQRKFSTEHSEYYLYQDPTGEYRTRAFGRVLTKFWEIFDDHLIRISPAYHSRKISKMKKDLDRLKSDFDVDVHQLHSFADEEYLLGARKTLLDLIKFLQYIEGQIR